MRSFFAMWLLGLSMWGMPHGSAFAQTLISDGLTGAELITALRQSHSPTSVRGYNAARDDMYSDYGIDLQENNTVLCIYTGLAVSYNPASGADPSTTLFNQGVNTEHTWPQSFFNSRDPMQSDMHHLFPSWEIANTSRSNNPFAEIPDAQTRTWLYNGTTRSTIPPSGEIDLYSESASGVFEPREDHKGNTARAIFYFWTIYQTNAEVSSRGANEAFFESMKDVLYGWHLQDPPDAREVARSRRISDYQGNENPFVVDTSLVRRAYFADGSGGGGSGGDGGGGDTGGGGGDTGGGGGDSGGGGSGDRTTQQPVTGVPADELLEFVLISQYYEGSSYNKWLEIANAGPFTVDFGTTPLHVHLLSNQRAEAPDGAEPNASYTLSGTLAPGQTLLLKNGQAVSPVHGDGLASGVVNFNGNDIVLLSKGESTQAWAQRTDVFGETSGRDFAKDVNFTRKASVTRAARTWDISEWEESPNGSIDNAIQPESNDYLGTHRAWSVVRIGGREGWRMMAFPTQQATLAEILEPLWTQGAAGSDSSEGAPSVYRHDPASGFQPVTDLSSSPATGEGYAVYAFEDRDFNGTADAFPVHLAFPGLATLPASTTLSLSSEGDGWNLIGNPYPHEIDWDEEAWTKTGVSEAVHIWDHEREGYRSWNGLVGVNGASDGVISAFQSFWVRTLQENAELAVDNHVAGEQRRLLRSGQEIEFEEVRVGSGEWQLSVLFHHAGEMGLDRFDAVAPGLPVGSGGSSEKRFTLNFQGTDYQILSLPMELEQDVRIEIPVLADDGKGLGVENPAERPINVNYPQTGGAVLTIAAEGATSSTDDAWETRPGRFELESAYPNPFNPETRIRFRMPMAAHVEIRVVDAFGRLVQILKTDASPGEHEIGLNLEGHSSGVYFVGVTWIGSGGAVERATRSITLLK